MEEMEIGVHEILQYACAVLSKREVQELLSDLETHAQVKYALTADSLENPRRQDVSNLHGNTRGRTRNLTDDRVSSRLARGAARESCPVSRAEDRLRLAQPTSEGVGTPCLNR